MTPALRSALRSGSTDRIGHTEAVPDAREDHPKRRGDAGRSASSARAHRYLAGIEPMLAAIMRAMGRSAASIALELTRRAVPKPRGGTVWTPADVRKLLRKLRMEG